MKVAVVGCGAVGSYYGACLARAGHEVHFLLRSDYEIVRRQGVAVRSPLGDFTVRPACARVPGEIGVVDVVLIGLKTTANDQFENLLTPLTGLSTAVVTLQNGLGNEEQLARHFRAEQILGGSCFVCLNRVEPGVICHFDHGLIVLGEFRRPPAARTHELAAAFHNGGVRCKVTDNLERAHWEKLVWNVPFNGLGVASCVGYEALVACGEAQARANAPFVFELPRELGACLPTDRLLADSRWTRLVRQLMLEVIMAARASGFSIPDSLADTQIERTRTMAAYRASTIIDFERGKPLELESLFLEPLRRARQAGLPAPRLGALCTVLGAIESARGR